MMAFSVAWDALNSCSSVASIQPLHSINHMWCKVQQPTTALYMLQWVDVYEEEKFENIFS